MTDIEQKGTLEFCAPKFLFCCQELPFVRMHIFCESSKRMDENEKNAGGNSGF